MDNQIDRVWISDALNHVGETIIVKGWVQSRRDHGKLIFIDLRDKSGLLQVVFFAGNTELFDNASFLRSEFVVSIEGTVKSRSERQVNLDIPTGTIELSAESLQIINESETPVFEIEKASETKEELRMKYRYLDLRSERMRSNLVNRHRVIKLVRDSLDQQNFLEIETPYLTKGTPEGAREFIVPARLSPGDFFVLPQSPQQFKQLLMVGGVERYFQIARCFRDEDTRGDRQAEFTQMDLEMSFVSQEDIMDLNEKLLIKIVAELYPEKRIQTIPFPRITYKDAMEKYGSDRPDIREDKNDPNLLAFCWIVDFPMFEKTDTAWTFTHNPFSATIPEHTQWLRNKEHIGEIIAAQYDVVLNGSEIGGGSIRNYRSDDLRSVLEIIGHTSETIEQDFGHIFKAFSFGAPPHGGIAWGVDRLIMILQNEQSIRDVIAFPKTGDGRDLLMDAPNSINPKQLKELGL